MGEEKAKKKIQSKYEAQYLKLWANHQFTKD